MGHEHFSSAADAWGNTPSDELARRMFATGQVAAVHVYGNIITVDLLGAVKGAHFQVAAAAFEWIQGRPSFGVGYGQPVLDFDGGDDVVAAVADGQQIFEFESKEVVPAVAFDIVVLVGVVLAGALALPAGAGPRVDLVVRGLIHKDERIEDHALAFSLYFHDPDGNMHEITTYEHDAVRSGLA